MSNLLSAINTLKITMDAYSSGLLVRLTGVWQLQTYSQTLVNFVLQFVPPPILTLFLIEIATGVIGVAFNVIGKFKLVIKWI
jgi:hypothetical protein